LTDRIVNQYRLYASTNTDILLPNRNEPNLRRQSGNPHAIGTILNDTDRSENDSITLIDQSNTHLTVVV
jgi:hypothetical protein